MGLTGVEYDEIVQRLRTGRYIIKWAEETAWAVGLAALIFVVSTVSQTTQVTDWRAYLLSLMGGAARVAAAVLLNKLRDLKDGGGV